MKENKLRRFTVYKVLILGLLLCSVLIPWALTFHARTLDEGMAVEPGQRYKLSYTKLSRLMREAGAEESVIPVTHGETVSVTLEEPLPLIVGRYNSRDMIQLIPAGSVIETSFFSAALTWNGYRACYAKVPGTDSSHRMTFHTFKTRDFARLYRSYLEQNGLAEAFEAETGRKLTQRNAVWALRSIDRELYEHGILRSSEVPAYIGPVSAACKWSLLLFFPLLILSFWLIDRRKHYVLHHAGEQQRSQAEAARWAATRQRLEAEAPIRSAQKPRKSNLDPVFDAWCRTAAGYVPRFRRGAIYAELYDHLLDHYTALLDGRDPEAAARIALTAMGDADETGRRLRRAEWTPHSIVRNARYLLLGRQWVVYYRGTDPARYAELTRTLTIAGIPFRTEEFDQLTRTIGAVIVPGRSNLDNSARRDGLNPNHFGTVTKAIRENVADSYIIYVRQRDMGASNRMGMA